MDQYRIVGVFGGKSVCVGEGVEEVEVGKMDVVVGAVEEVLVRGVRLGVGAEKEIEKVRDFQVESGVDEVVDHQVVSRDETGVRLTVFSVRKEMVRERLDCERLSCVPAALGEVGKVLGEGRCGVVWKDFAVVAKDGVVLWAGRGRRAVRSLGEKGLKQVFVLEKERWGGVDLGEYGVAVGLALGGGGLDFRQGEFAYRRRWRRERGRLLGFVGACLGVCVGVLLVGAVLVGREREMGQVAQRALGEVDAWESFELWPRVAGVRDVMAWVGTRVKRVESFRYVMGSRPRVGAEREKYGVRVEVVFEAESPTKAREFHDELLKGEGMVGEVMSWGMTGEKYRVVFGLRA